MSREIIRKVPSGWKRAPNLADYDTARSTFSWQQVEASLDGLPRQGGLNIAYEAIDRHANGERAQQVALRWIDSERQPHDYSYAAMQELTNRFANVLQQLGVAKDDCVCVLAPRIPELYIAALGTLKNGSVFCPLFSAFGPEPIRTRLAISKARVLVTSDTLYRRKVQQLRDSLPDLQWVLTVADGASSGELPDTRDLQQLLQAADSHFSIAPTDPEDNALLHFTSGSSGAPKGALHVHRAVEWHYLSAQLALDLQAGDIFWCTADPGWVTGTSYGIIAPLAIGATLVVDSGEFDAERWYRILQEQQINVWYTAPTAIRMLASNGAELAGAYDISKLRFIASVGEPLDAESVCWGQQVLGQPFHDTWWQTETGGIMIANFQSMDIKPGSMGRPLPGIEAAVVQRTEAGGLEILDDPGMPGELALRTGWPSMFRAYLDEPERYRKCFADGWYLTGDLVMQDADGYFWFVGRNDDVIKSSGHLISPFEVESVLLENPAVAEAGVIGKPDSVVKEVVKAFVVLKPSYEANDLLKRQLLGHCRKHLGAAVAPREIEFCQHLPKTRSGKILRRLLRAHELGLPQGDVSTLEDNNEPSGKG